MKKSDQLYLASLEALGRQISQSYLEACRIKLPKIYKQINKVVVCGMGGSQLGQEYAKYLFADKINLPIIQVRDYSLPKFVDKKTLVFLTSYSGTTEEVIKIATEVKKRTNKIFVITSGGSLATLAKKHNFLSYQFEPMLNPSGQPRTGTGYITGSFLAILRKLGQAQISVKDINNWQQAYAKAFKKYLGSTQLENFAKQAGNKVLAIVTAEHLQGNAHILANQLHESAKQLAIYFSLPELNHHLLEGLTFPKFNRQNLHFIFLSSQNYNLRNQKRFQVTQVLFKRQGFKLNNLSFKGNKIEQSAAALAFGSLLAFKLSQINKVNPNLVPWVDLFKAKMKKK